MEVLHNSVRHRSIIRSAARKPARLSTQTARMLKNASTQKLMPRDNSPSDCAKCSWEEIALNGTKMQRALPKNAQHAPRKRIGALSFFPIATFWLVAATTQAQSAMPMAASASASKVGMHGNIMDSPDLKQSMKSGMDNMQQMQMSGDTEKDFALMMKMHYQQALDMAEMQLVLGNSPELKTMASKIISGQKKEIAQFDRWLAKQK